MNWQDAKPPATLHLECGTEVKHEPGTPVYNYYDMKPGEITEAATYPQPLTSSKHGIDGAAWWVRVLHDDGTTALLDQSRMCSIEFARSRGWAGV
jgi:hypothetical protein